MFFGHLRSIKGTSPPIFTVLPFHFHHSLSTLSQIPNTTNLVQNWNFLAQKNCISTLFKTSWKVSSISVHMHD